MARWVSLLVALAFITPGVAQGQTEQDERARLQGNWVVISLVDDGETLSNHMIQKMFARDGKLTVKGPLITLFNPETNREEEIAFVVTPDVRPRAIDLAAKGRTRTRGIYMCDGDSILLCLGSPDSTERPKEFTSTKGSNQVLMTLTREKVIPVKTVSNNPDPATTAQAAKVVPPPVDPQAATRRKIIGTWGHQNDDDVVLMTMNPDGSFSSTRTPKKGLRKMFRDPVRTSGTWRLEENSFIVVRVTASTNNDMVGQILSYRIRSMTDSQVMLIDNSGKLHVEWKTP